MKDKITHKENEYNPLVSIVTVVFNDENNIENTLNSVISQSYNNIEYIVIDGGSSDNTLNIINGFKDSITVIISEKDKGIYDAMNKSLKYIKGDWVCFMNSGDRFYNDKVIETIFNFNSFCDIIYGDIIYKNNPNKIVKPRELNKFWKGLPFNHQASFVKTNIFSKSLFDLNYSISSVHDFFYKLYLNGYRFKYQNIVVAEYDLTGTSATSYLWLWDNWRINLKYSKSKLHLVIGALIVHFISKLKKDFIKIIYEK